VPPNSEREAANSIKHEAGERKHQERGKSKHQVRKHFHNPLSNVTFSPPNFASLLDCGYLPLSVAPYPTSRPRIIRRKSGGKSTGALSCYPFAVCVSVCRVLLERGTRFPKCCQLQHTHTHIHTHKHNHTHTHTNTITYTKSGALSYYPLLHTSLTPYFSIAPSVYGLRYFTILPQTLRNEDKGGKIKKNKKLQ